jgi:hypothetical protein
MNFLGSPCGFPSFLALTRLYLLPDHAGFFFSFYPVASNGIAKVRRLFHSTKDKPFFF